MKQLSRYSILLALLVLATASHANKYATFSGTEYAEMRLLVGSSDYNIRLAAMSAFNRNKVSREVLDIMAELAWSACAKEGRLKQDTLSWLVKVLGKSRNARYKNVMNHCLSGAVNKKTRDYVEDARKKLAGNTSDRFSHGKLDFTAIKKDLFRLVPEAGNGKQKKRFNQLKYGKGLDEVFRELGAPNTLTGASIRPGRAGHLKKSRYFSDTVIFKYDGLGKLHFFTDDKQPEWVLKEAESDAGLYWSMERGRFVTDRQMMEQAKGIELHKYANELIKRKTPDQAILELAANRIYASRNETDTQTIEGVGILCRLIGDSGKSRYRKMLMDVAENGFFSKTRKYALKAAQQLPESKGKDFIPSGQAR